MKKILRVAVALLIFAAVIRGVAGTMGFGPTKLILQIETPNGVDVTTQARVLLGYTAGDPAKSPALGNITLIKPHQPASALTYTIPGDQDIGVFVFWGDALPYQFTMRVAERGIRRETLVLGKGSVTLSTLRSDGFTHSDVTHTASGAKSADPIVVTDRVRLDLPVGTHIFSTPRQSETVNVSVGSDDQVVLDDLQGRVTLQPRPTIEWGDDFPDISFVAQPETGAAQYQTYSAHELTLPYGDYKIRPRLGYARVPGEPVAVRVDRPDMTVVVPLSVHIVRPVFNGWPAQDVADVRYGLYDGSNLGIALAEGRIGSNIPLVVAASDQVEKYAIAVMRNRDVIAFQELAPLPLDRVQLVAIQRRGNVSACKAVVQFENCMSLQR